MVRRPTRQHIKNARKKGNENATRQEGGTVRRQDGKGKTGIPSVHSLNLQISKIRHFVGPAVSEPPLPPQKMTQIDLKLYGPKIALLVAMSCSTKEP